MATDLHTNVVAKGVKGSSYGLRLRNVRAEFMRKYFTQTESNFRDSRLRAALRHFHRLNMLDDSKMLFMRASTLSSAATC